MESCAALSPLPRLAPQRSCGQRAYMTDFSEPEAIPFQADAESLALGIRAFLGLLVLRVEGGDCETENADYRLVDGTPDGLSMDRVVAALIRHGRDQHGDALMAALGGVDDMEDMRVEIDDSIKRLINPGE